MKLKAIVVAPTIGLLAGMIYGSYRMGRNHERQVTWLSELGQRVQNRNAYLVDVQIVCANGKVLGPLQVDLNLTNGKLRVVRNDAGTEPNCTK